MVSYAVFCMDALPFYSSWFIPYMSGCYACRATLRIVLPRVLGTPNNARANMDSIVALFEDSRTAEKAEKLANEFIEFIDSM